MQLSARAAQHGCGGSRARFRGGRARGEVGGTETQHREEPHARHVPKSDEERVVHDVGALQKRHVAREISDEQLSRLPVTRERNLQRKT